MGLQQSAGGDALCDGVGVARSIDGGFDGVEGGEDAADFGESSSVELEEEEMLLRESGKVALFSLCSLMLLGDEVEPSVR